MPQPDDQVSAELAPIRERRKVTFDDPAGRGRPDLLLAVKAAREDVPRLLAALDAALKLHAPRTDRVLGSACGKHRLLVPTLLPLPDCEECVQDRRREVCPECRDQYGDPVLFDLCRVRSAVLAALAGERKSGG